MPHDNNIYVQVVADEGYEHHVFGQKNVFRFMHEDGNGKMHFSNHYQCLNMERMYYHAECGQEYVTREEVNNFRKMVRKELGAVKIYA